MKNIDWDVVVVVGFAVVAAVVAVVAIVNGVGMKPMDSLRVVLYNTKVTLIP